MSSAQLPGVAWEASRAKEMSTSVPVAALSERRVEASLTWISSPGRLLHPASASPSHVSSSRPSPRYRRAVSASRSPTMMRIPSWGTMRHGARVAGAAQEDRKKASHTPPRASQIRASRSTASRRVFAENDQVTTSGFSSSTAKKAKWRSYRLRASESGGARAGSSSRTPPGFPGSLEQAVAKASATAAAQIGKTRIMTGRRSRPPDGARA